jgi:GTPase Era involved in 16S rRNA processing
MGTFIAICGAPLAGKRTLIETLSAEWNAKIIQYSITDTRFNMPHIALRLASSEFELHTVSGGVMDASVWQQMLSQAHKVIVVVDAQLSQGAANQKALNQVLPLIQGKNGCLIESKRDLLSENNLAWLETVALDAPFASWPRFKNNLPDLKRALSAL